ncbi:Aste57867_15669 [Aphanomyces stellatus]|uniref:Aste57867_15669 protein n=1 Tax=Aphanomyces stellatus TaxID=120398 RepID=A0A485L3Z0_9STRA|nr:hypothetical protein As57867_015613 [Aphanomyces stellatus]VFT92463.1 Aste57867_15669 [Aphanomyces stellatus]
MRYGRLDIAPLVDLAAVTSQLPTLQFLLAHGYRGCTTFTVDDAARNGHLEIVQWLFELSPTECTAQALDMAVSCGHLKVVRFLSHDSFAKVVLFDAAFDGRDAVVDALATKWGIAHVFDLMLEEAAARGTSKLSCVLVPVARGCDGIAKRMAIDLEYTNIRTLNQLLDN